MPIYRTHLLESYLLLVDGPRRATTATTSPAWLLNWTSVQIGSRGIFNAGVIPTRDNYWQPCLASAADEIHVPRGGDRTLLQYTVGVKHVKRS